MIRATASDIEALRAALAVAEARAEEAVAVDLAPQLLDHQFQGGDDRRGEMMAPALPFFAPLFAAAAMSARTKNLRRAWDQQSASVTGPGEQPSAYSLLYPA